jgi:thiol:disulfide interchange protein DsbA
MNKVKQYLWPIVCVQLVVIYMMIWSFERNATIEIDGDPVKGVDYVVLDYQDPANFGGKVTEFFWYSCGHCYNMEKHLATPEMKKAVSKWDFEQVHAPYKEGDSGGLWEDFNSYVLFKREGKEHTVGKQYMKLIHEDSFNRKDLPLFLADNNFTKEDEVMVMSGNSETEAAYEQYSRLFQQDKVVGVPAIIVGGKYLVKNYQEMEKVVNYLLTR